MNEVRERCLYRTFFYDCWTCQTREIAVVEQNYSLVSNPGERHNRHTPKHALYVYSIAAIGARLSLAHQGGKPAHEALRTLLRGSNDLRFCGGVRMIKVAANSTTSAIAISCTWRVYVTRLRHWQWYPIVRLSAKYLQ